MNPFGGTTETESDEETLGNLTVAVKKYYFVCGLYLLNRHSNDLRGHNLLFYFNAFCTEF